MTGRSRSTLVYSNPSSGASRCALCIKYKSLPWDVESGGQLLRVYASVAEPGICSILLPWLQNWWCLQKSIKRGNIKFNQLPLHSDLPGGFVFRIIQVCIKFLEPGHIYVPIHLPGQGFMPILPLKFLAKLIVLRDVKNNIPLWKNVPGVNVLIRSLLGAHRYESGSVIGLPGSGGGSFSLFGGHLHQKEPQESSETGFI